MQGPLYIGTLDHPQGCYKVTLIVREGGGVIFLSLILVNIENALTFATARKWS